MGGQGEIREALGCAGVGQREVVICGHRLTGALRVLRVIVKLQLGECVENGGERFAVALAGLALPEQVRGPVEAERGGQTLALCLADEVADLADQLRHEPLAVFEEEPGAADPGFLHGVVWEVPGGGREGRAALGDGAVPGDVEAGTAALRQLSHGAYLIPGSVRRGEVKNRSEVALGVALHRLGVLVDREKLGHLGIHPVT